MSEEIKYRFIERFGICSTEGKLSDIESLSMASKEIMPLMKKAGYSALEMKRLLDECKKEIKGG